jgi:hypothetical protein
MNGDHKPDFWNIVYGVWLWWTAFAALVYPVWFGAIQIIVGELPRLSVLGELLIMSVAFAVMGSVSALINPLFWLIVAFVYLRKERKVA